MTRKMVSCEAATQTRDVKAIRMPARVTRKPRRESCCISSDLKPELLLLCRIGCATIKVLLGYQGRGE